MTKAPEKDLALTPLERIYRIHEILRAARRPVPRRRFQEELEVSRNTITRDFEYLRDILGAPLIYDREANGHCYDPNEAVFELPGFWMNASELHALLACEQLLEEVQPGLMGPRLAPLKTRIRDLLGDSGRDAETVSRRVHVQPVRARHVPGRIFAPVAEATLGNKVLELGYTSRSPEGGTHGRRVHPQRLLHYRHNWYLLAWCEHARGLRLFSLDRIAEPRMTDKPARHREESELDAFVGEGFGIFGGEAAGTARLRFSRHAATWVAEESWHPEQRGEWRDDGYYLNLPYADARELTRDILAWGAEVEVLGPPELRADVYQRLREAASRYGENGAC